MKRPIQNAGIAASTALLLAACAGAPRTPPSELVMLQNELARIGSDACIVGEAGDELREAERAVAVIADEGRRMRGERYEHNLYLATRLVRIAEAEGRARCAENYRVDLAGQREDLLLQARTQEAERAQARAEAERRAAEQARLQAMAERSAAEQARLDAILAEQRAAAAQAELDRLNALLADLQARQTERGLVVTLGDVLFELDRAELKPGAMRNLDKLADALHQHPEALLLIEGHTDATGTRDYNLSLSQRRADAVMAYLASRGIERSRMRSDGLGPDFPVASNADAAGRQQNRRVEVIIQQEG